MMTITQVGPDLTALTAEMLDRLATAQAVNADILHETLLDTEPIRTGYMRDSTHTVQLDRWHYTEAVDAPYASFVNDGTRYMAPRYFVERALAATEPAAIAACWDALNGVDGWQG